MRWPSCYQIAISVFVFTKIRCENDALIKNQDIATILRNAGDGLPGRIPGVTPTGEDGQEI